MRTIQTVQALQKSKIAFHLFLLLLFICSFQVRAQKINFNLQLEDETYSGTIYSQWFDKVTITPVEPDNLVGAVGKMTGKRGSMNFEITTNATGSQEALMLKTNNGWYPLTDVEQADSKLGMTFDWAFRPTFRAIDMEILQRAHDLLDSNADWNNQDDRLCENDFANRKWSLYCVMKQASIDVIGDFNHRGASLNEVRNSIMQKKPNAKYAHRLRDFNNEEDFEQVKDAITMSIERMRKVKEK